VVDLVDGRVVKRTVGRPRGMDKTNSDIRRMILVALNNAGGAKYLERQAHANPVAFMGLLGKILPHQMKLEADMKGDQPVTINLSWLTPDRFNAPWREEAALLQDIAPQALGAPLRASPDAVPVVVVKDGSDLW